MSNYIETVSGRKVYLPHTTVDSIDIFDIAHALSYACRFAGHIDRFYSVAEHSIHVAEMVAKPYKLQALLHDATEAYLCDIPTPFKALLPEYKKLEASLWSTIACKFGVPVELHESVKYADRIMLMTERDNLKKKSGDWGTFYETTPRMAVFDKMKNNEVKDAFLFKFADYVRIP